MRRFIKFFISSCFLCPLALSAASYHGLECSEESSLFEALEFSSRTTTSSSPATLQSTPAGAIESEWAHERTGTDLDRRDVFGEPPAESHMGFIDSGFDSEAIRRASGNRFANRADISSNEHFHGTGVVNTALDFNRNSDVSFAWQFKDLYQPDVVRQRLQSLELDSGRKKPKVVNISYAMGNSSKVLESLNLIEAGGSLVVASAGNFGDEMIHENNRAFKGVLVGSISPFGIESDYSQTGREVDILAPADYYLGVNYDGYSESQSMGTSFSSPIVAGILSEAVGVLGEDVPNEFLEDLMKKTSIETISGIGMINRDKLLAVANRIRTQGRSFSSATLNDSSLFDFSSKSRQLQSEAMAAYRSGDRKQATQLLKLAFNLDQNNDSLRTGLISLYEEQGVLGTADFYRSLTPHKAEQVAYLQRIAASDSQALGLQTSAARLLARLNQSGVDLEASETRRLANAANDEQRIETLERLSQRSPNTYKDQAEEIYSLTNSSNAHIRNLALLNLTEIRNATEAEVDVELDPKSFEKQSRQRQAATLQFLRGPRAWEASQRSLLERLASQGQELQIAFYAVRAIARSFQPTGAVESFQRVRSTPSPAIRATIDRLQTRLIRGFDQAQVRGLIGGLADEPALIELHRRDSSIITPEAHRSLRLILFDQPRELIPMVRLYYLRPDESLRKDILSVLADAIELYKFAEPERQKSILIEHLSGVRSRVTNNDFQSAIDESLKSLQSD